MVDDQPNTYTAIALKNLKKKHEKWVQETLHNTTNLIPTPPHHCTRIRQFLLPRGKHLHGARLELGDFRLRVECVVRQQVRGGFGEVEGDEDHAHSIISMTCQVFILFLYNPITATNDRRPPMMGSIDRK